MNRDDIVKELKEVLSKNPRITHYANYFFPISESLYKEIAANVNLAEFYKEFPILEHLELRNVPHPSMLLPDEENEKQFRYFFLVRTDSLYIRELDKRYGFSFGGE